MNKLGIEDLQLKGKRVLVRVDFNVPLEGTKIIDDTRITSAIPTIKYITENGGKAILMSHLGRPDGKVVPEYSLALVAKRLSEILGKDVILAPDCIGEETKNIVAKMKEGDVVLLENLRFHAGEENNDPDFARKLAELGDVFVNDAFGAAHRAHASTVGITKFVPKSAVGFLMQREIEYIKNKIDNPERPFIAIIAGSKISDKIGIIEHLMKKADAIIIAGAMAYTFLKAMGRKVGNSLVEDDKLDLARETLKKSLDSRVPLYLPIDHVVADRFSNDANRQIVMRGRIPDGWEGMDIGPATIELFRSVLEDAKTIVWNGPVGVFEFDNFAKGSIAIAKILSESNAITIVGGGDCVAAVQKSGYADKITHISTGGGSALELMEGKDLPGIVALTDKN
ncbi:MAG: phosphoglycerate kinase [Candidatus Poribacteria bacterium]